MSTAAIVALATVLSACVTAAITYAVAMLGRATSKESTETQRFAEQIDGYRGLLEETRRLHDDRLRALESDVAALTGQNGRQAGQITTLQEENTQHTRRINTLERALAAARQYVSDLLTLLRLHNIPLPDPPDDYTTD
jgi:septal ring factor EnvC (AmiA/AmiB activator)